MFALREVYVRLAKQKLYANPWKCCFGQSEVEYCGFIIGRNGIRPQPRKLMAVNVWPQLKNSTDVKSFLGLCGFYQRFVAYYATVATPMTNLMGKKAVWKCGEEEEMAFQALKALKVVAVPGVDGAEFQVAYDTAHGCVRGGCWCYVVTEG